MSTTTDLQKDYRKTIGLFATGVTVVLTDHDGAIRGMTANAVTSLSLDPLQLIFCPAKSSRFTETVQVGARFSVNILASEQRDVSDFFAKSPEDALSVGRQTTEKADFELVSWGDHAARIDGSLASIACTVDKMLDGGDHWIVCGQVHELSRQDDPSAPLIFFNGGYRFPEQW